MDLIRINIHEIREGALLRARGREATRIMRHVTRESEQEAGDWALDQVKHQFHEHFKRPTGYYESHVYTKNTGGHVELTDGGHAGPVYGPWLEGVGSRNITTRFKGYHAFRIVTTMLEERYARMGENVLRRWARRL